MFWCERARKFPHLFFKEKSGIRGQKFGNTNDRSMWPVARIKTILNEYVSECRKLLREGAAIRPFAIIPPQIF